MKNKIYHDFAEVKAQIKFLEEQESLLKAQIIKDLHKRKVDKLEGEFGTFTICNKKKYTYSKKLQKLEEDLKIKKYEEQEKGVAKVEVSEYIKFETNE